MDEPVSDAAAKKAMLLVAAMTFFLFPFMAASVNIALPSIGAELALDGVTLGWITTAYLLASAVFLVPFGRMADIYGRKKVFTSGIVIFTIASLLAAVAGSGLMLISFRILQGIGVSMLAGTAVALLTGVFPLAERGKVLGINAMAAYAGLALGPVLGGVITQHLGWRAIFFLNVPLGLIVIGAVLWKLKGEWTGARGEKFDFAGSALYTLALLALIYGFTTLPAISGIWLVVAGIIGLTVFTRLQLRSRSPVLNTDLFRKSRTFTFSSLAAVLEYSPVLAISFLMSLYLQYVRDFTPESAGLVLVAMPAISAMVSPLAGRLSDRIEPRVIASAGMAITTVGVALFIFFDDATPLWSVVAGLVVVGCGLALFASPNINAVMSSAPRSAYGVASAMVATTRQIGMVFGMGIAMLMLAAYMGRVEITPEYFPLFQTSMRTSFIVLAALCFGGIFVSLTRGRIRQPPLQGR